MPYTHIQCIGYQVPTVAKVGYKPAVAPPIAPPPPPPAPQPDGALDPPIEAHKVWSYRDRLISYLATLAVADPARALVQAMVDYLKYHTGWYKSNATWTIPSGDADKEWIQPILIKGISYQMDILDEDVKALRGDKDAYNRVVRFLNVLLTAKNNKVIDNAQTTLKVFMAPEFYFRPEVAQGGYNAYSYEIYQAIKNVLRKKIEELDFKDWLIIPGTIMWKVPQGQAAGSRGPLAADTYFNSCVYIYHDTGAARTSHVLQKAKASHIDGVPLGDSPTPTSAPQILPKYDEKAKRNKHVFTIGGLRIGLEICLEHVAYVGYSGARYGVLKSVLVGYVYSSEFLHLQLLTAGGMQIKSDSVVLLEKGAFLRNDGLSGPPFVESKYQIKLPVSTEPTLSDFVTLSSEGIAPNNAKLYLNPPVPNAVAGEVLFEDLPFNEQKIIIYQSRAIT